MTPLDFACKAKSTRLGWTGYVCGFCATLCGYQVSPQFVSPAQDGA
jgi:hypothetical protein